MEILACLELRSQDAILVGQSESNIPPRDRGRLFLVSYAQRQRCAQSLLRIHARSSAWRPDISLCRYPLISVRFGTQGHDYAALRVELRCSGPVKFVQRKIAARATRPQIGEVIAFDPILGYGIDHLVFQSKKRQSRGLILEKFRWRRLWRWRTAGRNINSICRGVCHCGVRRRCIAPAPKIWTAIVGGWGELSRRGGSKCLRPRWPPIRPRRCRQSRNSNIFHQTQTENFLALEGWPRPP